MDLSLARDFLDLTRILLNLNKIHMRDINDLVNLLYHMHFWPLETFYRNQISSIDLEKHYFLCRLVILIFQKL